MCQSIFTWADTQLCLILLQINYYYSFWRCNTSVSLIRGDPPTRMCQLTRPHHWYVEIHLPECVNWHVRITDTWRSTCQNVSMTRPHHWYVEIHFPECVNWPVRITDTWRSTCQNVPIDTRLPTVTCDIAMTGSCQDIHDSVHFWQHKCPCHRRTSTSRWSRVNYKALCDYFSRTNQWHMHVSTACYVLLHRILYSWRSGIITIV